jgi:hypothetical protein
MYTVFRNEALRTEPWWCNCYIWNLLPEYQAMAIYPLDFMSVNYYLIPEDIKHGGITRDK